MLPIKIRAFIMRFLEPRPRLRWCVARLYHASARLRKISLRTAQLPVVLMACVYIGFVFLAAVFFRNDLKDLFGPERPGGWHDCTLSSENPEIYFGPYHTYGSGWPSLYVRILRKALRVIRRFAKIDDVDDTRPPTDIYALF